MEKSISSRRVLFEQSSWFFGQKISVGSSSPFPTAVEFGSIWHWTCSNIVATRNGMKICLKIILSVWSFDRCLRFSIANCESSFGKLIVVKSRLTNLGAFQVSSFYVTLSFSRFLGHDAFHGKSSDVFAAECGW